MYISSNSNEKIKFIKKLLKSAKERRENDLYIVEGIRMFREIPVEDIVDIYISEDVSTDIKKEAEQVLVSIREINPDFELTETSANVFKSMSDTDSPQGILTTVRMKHNHLRDVLVDDAADKETFLLIAEHLQDPGNLGTIIRTAEGAGVSGIMLSTNCADIYSPKVVRSTMGAIFRVPIYVSEDLEADIDRVKETGVVVYGTHLDGDTFYDNDYTKGCAFLIGNEGNGLSEKISSKADKLIRIPMMGSVESLNAAISTAVVSYEVLRQRLQ